MADYASSRMSLSRASTLLNRPNQAPQGPRIRNRSSNVPGEGFSSPVSPASSSPSLFTVLNGSIPPYLPEFGPGSPTTDSAPLSPITEVDPKPLVNIPEPPTHPPPPPPPQRAPSRPPPRSRPRSPPLPPISPPPASAPPPAVSNDDDAPEYTQEPAHINEVVTVLSPATTALPMPSSPAASTSTSKTMSNPPKLAPPPSIKFDSVPVPWKGLPLEAAVWTFDSKELQSIVSRAIRSSASESFVRLLTLENLDKALPAEIERLEGQKAMSQAKYRFLVHRRTMQLQALVSSSLSPNHKDKDPDDGLFTVTKLAIQLSETSAECDQLMEELLKISDQLTQVKKLLDHHWASALAVALRKLNASYGRRTSDLSAAKEKIEQLEAELEDAWTEAEKIAREMDEFDAAMSDDDEAVIEYAEKISFARTETSPIPDAMPLSPTILSVETMTPVHHIPQLQLSQLSPLSPISPIILKSPAQNRNSRGIEAVMDVPDSVSIRSTRSNKSSKSNRSGARGDNSRISLVSAAKIRSHRASQGSLRLPSSPHRKQSTSRPKTPYEEQPPVPNLPMEFTSPVMSTASANASSALLHLDDESLHFSGHAGRRTSLDSARVTSGHQTPIMWGRTTKDDLCIKQKKTDESSFGKADGRLRVNGDEIQTVPRTPPVPMKTIPMEEYMSRPRVVAKDRHTDQTIPSIWMNADAPKTPAERLDTLMHQNSKSKTYQRLRTLTKRYSLPFPMFASKANNSQRETRPPSHRSD